MTQIACHECDLLLDLPDLEEGQRAYCPRCNHLLCSHPHDGIQRALAYAMAATVFLGIANLYPFISFKAEGLEQVMTLMLAPIELYREGSELLAAFVLIFIILAPLLLLICIIWTLSPLVFTGKRASGSYGLGRIIFTVSPWSMAEVFLIGIFVSMTKIAGLATVVFGISFWAYVGFAISFTMAMASLDQHYYWDALEQA